MQSNINVWTLVTEATFIVQLVLFILVASSIASWTIIFNSFKNFRKAEADAYTFEDRFWSGQSLSKFYEEVENQAVTKGMTAIFRTGFQEYMRLHKQGSLSADAIASTAVRTMQVFLSRDIEALSRHLNFLSIVASTAPYIGLFGTVWGIMHAFLALQDIGKTASLALVAPGIAEALVATAIGLFAAIPAVIAYNHFTEKTNGLVLRYNNFIEEFTAILQKQVLHSSR